MQFPALLARKYPILANEVPALLARKHPIIVNVVYSLQCEVTLILFLIHFFSPNKGALLVHTWLAESC